MLRIVQEIDDFSAGARFPSRAGSFRTDLASPALEFVKAVCKHAFVLSDSAVELAREMEENTDETIRARYAKRRAAVATARAAPGLDARNPVE